MAATTMMKMNTRKKNRLLKSIWIISPLWIVTKQKTLRSRSKPMKVSSQCFLKFFLTLLCVTAKAAAAAAKSSWAKLLFIYLLSDFFFEKIICNSFRRRFESCKERFEKIKIKIKFFSKELILFYWNRRIERFVCFFVSYNRIFAIFILNDRFRRFANQKRRQRRRHSVAFDSNTFLWLLVLFNIVLLGIKYIESKKKKIA